MSTTLKVLSAKKVVASHQINQGDMLVIEARDSSNYQLINDQSGLGPQNIIAKREGKDLKIFLEDGDMSPDVVIQNYYGDENGEETSNLIVGQHENGGIYAYVPESGLKSDAVSMLAEEVAAPQALGGEDLGSAFWAFNPWWLLALVPLAAGIAIAAHDSGSSGSSDNSADKPVLKAENDGSITVKPGNDNTKVEITYTDENGNPQKAVVTKGNDGKWVSNDPNVVVNGDGTFTIPADSVKDNSKVTAVGTDDNGNKADANAVTAGDTKKPGDSNGDGVVDGNDDSSNNVKLPNGQEVPRNTNGAPNIVFGEDENGDGKLNGTEITGKDGKDTTPVYVTIPDNTEVGDSLIVTINGKPQTISVTQAMINKGYATVDVPVASDGDITVTAKVTDPAGNSSGTGEQTITVDTTPPASPTITVNNEGSATVDLPDDADKVTVTVPQENGPDKEVVLTKDPNGNWTSSDPSVIPNPENGKGNVTIPKENIKQGGEITAKAEDEAGNSTTDTADLADKPTIASPNNDGKVMVTPGDDNNKVEVNIPTEPDGQEKTITAEKDADSKWTIPDDNGTGATVDPVSGVITIPSGSVKDGEPIKATGTNPEGNKADADIVNAGTEPVTPPSTPRIPGDVDNDGDVDENDDDETTENGAPKLTIPEAKDGIINKVEAESDDGVPAEVTLPKNTKAGDTVTLKVITPDGEKEITHKVTEPEESAKKVTVTIPTADIAKDGDYKVTAKVTTPEGQSSKESTEVPFKVDQTKVSVNISGAEDGIISAAEKDAGVTAEVSLPKTAKAGDLVEVVITQTNGAPITVKGLVTEPESGKLSIPLGDKVDLAHGVSYQVEAKHYNGPIDPKNLTSTSEKQSFEVDLKADQPNVEAQQNGSVTIEPGNDNVHIELKFNDENETPKTVIAERKENGWEITDADGTTVSIDGGKIVIPAEQVKDKSTVTANAKDKAGNPGYHEGDTYKDSMDAGVDNSNNDGVVSAPSTTDEGTNIVTTVKLTNNNGNEKLAFNLPSGTGEGQLSADDFNDKTTFTFSDSRITMNDDDSLNVPAGITSFTITTPVKADQTTEVEEKGKFKVGGVEGNEVTVNDTSTAETPKIDINHIAGQTQVAEGTDGYAQFLPYNVATEKISETTENGVTKVVKGFVISGTSGNVPADTEVTITIQQADGTGYYIGKAAVAADGTWSIKVPTVTVTTPVTGAGEDEVTDVATVFNYPKFDESYSVTTTATVNGKDITDTDKTEGAPIVKDIYLEDKLTDDAPNANDFYMDPDTKTDKYIGRVDGMADSDATKAMSRQTGLTNDPSAELHFTLDRAPHDGEVVKVLRYTIVDGNEGRVEDLTSAMTNNGLDYIVKPTTPQEQTVNTLYRYKVVVEDKDGVDLSEKAFNYRLDTIVEAMDVKELNSNTNTMVLQADGISELGATIKYKYYTGSGESTFRPAIDNGDGTYTLNLANWNRKVNSSITLQVVDAAGNVSETKINAVRNLFNDYTLEKGLDPNGSNFDDPLITGLGPKVGGQSASLVADNPQTFAATEGNDTLIVGLDNFGGMSVGNGSVGRGIYVGGTVHIEMGKGDDHIQVRGTTQSMGADADGYFDMGEGNDKLTFGGSFVIGNYNIRMGEGNNIVNFSGTTLQTATLDISYGEGNDVLRADANKNFAGGKIINFGSGDNYMEVGAMHDANTITFGEGNDVFIAKSVGTKAPASGTIDMGDGSDTFVVSGLFARQEAKLGAGDDVAIMGDRIETGAAWGRLDGGDGNDTLVLTKSEGTVSLQNVLNFEVIDLTAPTTQTVGISNDYIKQENDTTKAIYIKGDTNDTVDFGDNGKHIDGIKFKDGGGLIKSNWNFWEKTASDVIHDGITYDKYTYRTSSGDVNDEAIYVQQGIQII